MEANEAKVGVTFAGQYGELPDPVSFDAADGDIKQWIAEALRAGTIPGITADPNASLTDYVVERFSATEERPYNMISVRPKTPFGM